MYGPLLSVLLMGMVPVWGVQHSIHADLQEINVAPPGAYGADGVSFSDLERRLSASGVVIADLDSGQTLYARAAETARPMASLTKLMTALLIVERHDLSEVVTVPRDIGAVSGNVVHLSPGDTLTVGDLLSALLIMSANDAAVTLARYDSGSTEAFVAAMNQRAAQLGLKHTVYVNPTGLDATGQRSSPQDLAWLTMYVLRNPLIAERMSRRGEQIVTGKGKTISLTHTHALLHADTSVKAGKTGTTDGAGQCLLSVVNSRKRQYVVILMRSLDRYADMRAVLDVLPH